MRKSTLRVLSRVMCLILLASVVLQAPLMAVETIPVNVGGQTFRVTPGQWVSVRSGTQVTHYNVRFVNGRPVALEMSQYTKLVFGDAGVAGSVADDVAASSNTGSTSSSNSTNTTSTNSTNSTSSSNTAGSVADDVAASGNPLGGNNAGSVADDFAMNGGGTTADDFMQSTGAVADDVAQAGTAGQVADDIAQAGTAGQVADDIAQAGTAGQVADDIAQAGTAGQVADDIAQAGTAGSIADDVAQAGTTTTTTSTNSTTTTTTKRAWDPSRHPRDPQTGRFISHEEAIKRGLMDPGSVADDIAQSGTAGQVADDIAQSGTAGQVADDVAQTNGKPGFKDQVSGKFQSGYYAGKGMVNQGFDNVKTSLKSGFSAKNLLITAGITVGVDLATQIMRGEKPSAKKALKTVCSAEFVGGVSGAVVGAAAGSFFVPFLSAIPVVGGALSALAPTFGSIVGSSVGAYTAGDLKNGKFSIREAFKKIDWVGVAGQTIGSTLGATLGSAIFPPFGTIVGGIVGGYVGNWAAQKVAGFFGKDANGAANLPDIAMPGTSSNPLGGYTGGEVTIGDVADTNGAASAGVSDEDVLIIGGDSEVIGGYESEVQLAYSKYQELYKLYNEMLNQGRQEDALAVAGVMNQAKKEYDDLRAQNK